MLRTGSGRATAPFRIPRLRWGRTAFLCAALATAAFVLAGSSQGYLPSQSATTPGSTSPGTSSVAAAPTPALAAPLATIGTNSPSTGEVIHDVDFARPPECADSGCSVQLDIFVPVGTGPFPTVVLVRGGPTGPGGRGYVAPFAQQLAAAGVIVFNADMRDIAATGGGYPEAFEDVACAIRYARTWSSAYGGNGNSVTLVGHSLGGYVGSVVALDPTEFEGGCLASGSGRPDAFVGLSGNYDLTTPTVAGDLVKFFGGSPADTAPERLLSDPFTAATGSPIPVRLVAGATDTTVPASAAIALDSLLAGEDWDVAVTVVPGGGHQSILNATGQGATSVGVVLEAIQAAGG
jgi:acetyl esterase/lipase